MRKHLIVPISIIGIYITTIILSISCNSFGENNSEERKIADNNISENQAIPLDDRSNEVLLKELEALKQLIPIGSIDYLGQTSSKIEAIEEILQERREREELIKSYFKQIKYSSWPGRSIEFCNKILDIDPKNAKAFFKRGELYLAMARVEAKNNEEKEKYIKKANQDHDMAKKLGFRQVQIDIKPGSDPNCFNNDGHGVIPIAILGAPDFDVRDIDPGTIGLEYLEEIKAVRKNDKLLANYEDIDSDGYEDLEMQFQYADIVFIEGYGTLTLTGELYDGTPIAGKDSICFVQ